MTSTSQIKIETRLDYLNPCIDIKLWQVLRL